MNDLKDSIDVKNQSTLTKLDRNSTALLIIDVQEKLMKAIENNELILSNIKKLMTASNILKFEKFLVSRTQKNLVGQLNHL